ncbi:hypothetical protein P9209_17795 [Prescottella defluvii]|nr:hypothetical protein P9209_17795 [Prescottella defluvii]
MRVAQSWLTEILQRATPDWQVTADELDAGFVRVGLEVEEVDPLEPVTGPLVVGRVLEIEELTEFKKPIRFCKVEVGADEPQEIVCGAGTSPRVTSSSPPFRVRCCRAASRSRPARRTARCPTA